jgi:hypothetical protein
MLYKRDRLECGQPKPPESVTQERPVLNQADETVQDRRFRRLVSPLGFGIFDGETIRSSAGATHPDDHDGDCATVIFTDRSLATGYLADRGGLDGPQCRMIVRPAVLLEFLAVVESEGMTHVVFDHERGTNAASLSIAELRVHAAGWAAG